MGVGTVHTRDLDAFVAECDRLGGIAHPAAAAYTADYRLTYSTPVNKALDPFSPEYFAQQLALYAEIAGRPLDQLTGEQMPLDVDGRVGTANPYGVRDVNFISRNARAIHTCMMMANLPASASVLDAGSGWGLSSEMIAFCGADVTAVDINPLFVELVRRRSERLGLPITSVAGTFDSFDTDRRFDMLFFYECLHHSAKVWETVERLGKFVKHDGKVVFAGEPINDFWWPHWGLRLDQQSVYCIRKFGWWESGWTSQFIVAAFARAGFDLQVFPHVGLENGIIGLATRKGVNPRPALDLKVMEPFNHPAPVAPPPVQLLAEVASLREKVASLEKSLVETRVERDAHKAKVTSLRQSYKDLLNSRSWKVTAPMRFVFQKLGLNRGEPLGELTESS